MSILNKQSAIDRNKAHNKIINILLERIELADSQIEFNKNKIRENYGGDILSHQYNLKVIQMIRKQTINELKKLGYEYIE